MKELEERIKKEGIILPNDVLKVGSFLNQQIDIELLSLMSKEVKRLFGNEKITKVLTVEASGLPFATMIANEFRVPLVFAKKSLTSNISGSVVKAQVESFTHQTTNTIFVTKDYINENDYVLIADDFLAKGNALKGLISIVLECKAKVVGCAIQIEKAYQGGGDEIRKKGIRIESLASIKYMSDKEIIFQ